MTVEQATYDVLEVLNQVSDDHGIDPRLVRVWLSLAAAEGMNDYLLRYGELPPNCYVRTDCVAVSRKDTECGDTDCKSYILTLSLTPMNLPNDKTVQLFYPVTMRTISPLGSMEKAAKMLTSKFFKGGWYRVKETIYLVGQFPETFKATVLTVPGDYNQLEATDPFPVPDAIQRLVIENAIEKGLRKLGEVPEDLNNDGKSNDRRSVY